MKNKKLIIVISLIVIIIIIIRISIVGTVCWLMSEQYNSNGVSHFLIISVDESQPKEFVGILDDHNVYVEKLAIDDLNFRTKNAENISIKEAIEKKLVSIEDWRNYAWRKIISGDSEIIRHENYEIVITNNECIIRPII